MRNNRSVPPCPVIPVLYYPDPSAAAEWLEKAFGFTVRLRIANHRIQMRGGLVQLHARFAGPFRDFAGVAPARARPRRQISRRRIWRGSRSPRSKRGAYRAIPSR